jgi:hypothetical protein
MRWAKEPKRTFSPAVRRANPKTPPRLFARFLHAQTLKYPDAA